MKTVKDNKIILGLTGGIASGKSTAANFFKSKNILVFDSDLEVKRIWEENEKAITYVKDKYNIDIKTNIGKKALANLIFNDKKVIKDINDLIHPLVFESIDRFIKENSNEKVLIIDMPLLFETGYYKKVDLSVLIYVDLNTQIERLMKRDNLSRSDALTRINAQMSLEDKKALSNYIINNNKDDIKILEEKLEALLSEVLKDETRR